MNQKQELFKTIWAVANDLRGAVDGWDFKNYVLGFLFYRYISENITNYINQNQKVIKDDFNYSSLDDKTAELSREELVKDKGFFILPSELFENLKKRAKQDDNLNETISRIFKNIENSSIGGGAEQNFKGLFQDIDVNSNKLGATVELRNKKLVKILDSISQINFGNFLDNSIDAFGDAYEYLMSMYASIAGKSGGEFFTPQEVATLLTKLALVDEKGEYKKTVNKVYDPCCGSGSLLLKFSKILGSENVKNGFYGQEINLTTYNLCKINMFLHNISYDKFNIALGDTLTEPKHWDFEPFEAIVSNPPYSIKWEGSDNITLINDERFSPAGILAPKSKADLAFTMHMLSWLAPSGTASIVEFPGVLYRTGAEQKIRQYLVDNNFIDCIIQLSDNLFFGTSIATCILILKKNKKDNNILFIDASEEFIHIGNKNKLSDENIQSILNTCIERKDKEYISALVKYEDIKNNDYNLSVSKYVGKKDNNVKVDISN